MMCASVFAINMKFIYNYMYCKGHLKFAHPLMCNSHVMIARVL